MGIRARDIVTNQVLEKLAEGNKRHIIGKALHPNQSVARRLQVAGEQEPFAVILGCSDSRVPPEVIFDQGLGDLYVVRVAGNVVDDLSLASIELAVAMFDARLIVVLGHTGCAAVQAAVRGRTLTGKGEALLKALQPAVERARRQPGDRVEQAVRANVAIGVSRLKSSEPVLSKAVTDGRVAVAGAVYGLVTGAVEFIA